MELGGRGDDTEGVWVEVECDDVFRENSPDLANSWAVAAIFLVAVLLSLYKNMYLDVNNY